MAKQPRLSRGSGTRLYALPDSLELRAELGLDSISLTDLAIAMATTFRVDIGGDELAACVTLGHLSRLIHDKTARDAVPFVARFRPAD